MAEKDKKPKGFSLIKLALFLLIIVLIAGVAVYSFLRINPADILADGAAGLYHRIFNAGKAEFNETVKTMITYDANEKVSFDTVSDDLVIASISSVKIIDAEGREKGYIPVSLKKPYIQTNNKDILVVDMGGRYFGLVNEGRMLWEKSIDEDIVNASISDSWVLLITKSKQSGYKRTVRAFSRDGQEVSLRNVSNYYPYSASHFPDFSKTDFIVNGIEASGLEANSLIDFLDLAMNQKASIRGVKEIYMGGISLKKETLLLYGERSLMLIDQGYNTLWEKKLTDAAFTGANVIDGKYPISAELNTEILSRERRHETTIRIFNSDGSERKAFLLDAKVTGLSSKGRTAAIKAGSEVFFINMNGDIMDRFTAKSDIIEVHLAKEDLAYVISAGTVSRIEVKVTNRFLGIF